MIENFLYGTLVRVFQVLVFSAPWIVAGVLIAAVLRVYIGGERLRRMFGGTGWQRFFLAWAAGLILPVCSLGVIPILAELHRVGIRRGPLLTFAISAPLFNPISLAYAMTLANPTAIVAFVACSLVISVFVGWAWECLFPQTPLENRDDPPFAPGIKRIAAFVYSAAKTVSGPVLIYLLIGILGSALLSAALPHGELSELLEEEPTVTPLLIALLGIPVYTTPLLVTSQLGALFQFGNSITSAFCLLMFGAVLNLGMLAWLIRNFNIRKTMAFIMLFTTMSLGTAYMINKPLYPDGMELSGHSHIFDIYSSPFAGEGNYRARAEVQLAKYWEEDEVGATWILAGLLVAGVLLSISNRFLDIESWWIENADQPSRVNALPAWLIRTVASLAAVIFGVLGCYVYFPAPGETLDQMMHTNLDVLEARLGNWDTARRAIETQVKLSRSLEIGALIRLRRIDQEQRNQAQELRDRLVDLRLAVEQEDRSESEKRARQADLAYRNLSAAFRE